MGFGIMVILDTHVWIWYVTECPKLSGKALKAIQNSDICGVSAISCWEVAMLVEKKRIDFNLSIDVWIKLALEFEKIQLIPLQPGISIQAAKMGDAFHGDPADRIIAATAMISNSILITKDKKIRETDLIKTIW
jgi:PIN domain nuclease of toxin-antitoxin system